MLSSLRHALMLLLSLNLLSQPLLAPPKSRTQLALTACSKSQQASDQKDSANIIRRLMALFFLRHGSPSGIVLAASLNGGPERETMLFNPTDLHAPAPVTAALARRQLEVYWFHLKM